MGRPEVPHCKDCPDAVKSNAPGGGYNIYCPYINAPGIVHIPWWDRQHTSPGDCPRRWKVVHITRDRMDCPAVRGEGRKRAG